MSSSIIVYRVLSVSVTFAALIFVWLLAIEGIPFLDFTTEYIIQLITSAILLSLFIERTIEIILSAWRGIERKNKVQALIAARTTAKAAGIRDEYKLLENADVKNATNELEAFRAENRGIAILTGLTLGIIVSSLGIRLIEPLLDPEVIGEIGDFQLRLLVVVDVFITGALLGGGAKGLHSILDLFLTAVDQKRKALKDENPAVAQ